MLLLLLVMMCIQLTCCFYNAARLGTSSNEGWHIQRRPVRSYEDALKIKPYCSLQRTMLSAISSCQVPQSHTFVPCAVTGGPQQPQQQPQQQQPRIFTFGIGSFCNHYFLKTLAGTASIKTCTGVNSMCQA